MRFGMPLIPDQFAGSRNQAIVSPVSPLTGTPSLVSKG
jgi:hypothetical protein